MTPSLPEHTWMKPSNGGKMRKWAKEHGLLLANAGIFLVFFGGMILSGAAAYTDEQQSHGQPAVTPV
jgi:hypothetical protein